MHEGPYGTYFTCSNRKGQECKFKINLEQLIAWEESGLPYWQWEDDLKRFMRECRDMLDDASYPLDYDMGARD